MDTPDFTMAGCYSAAGYQLIPLHFPSDASEYKGKARKDGKRPLHSNWTKRQYSNDDVLEDMKSGRNIGVRLKPTQLVIDVDPRNMPEGRDTFLELCEAIELDVDKYPVVITGSGGLHVYMTKPEHTKLVDSLEDFPGVEFKSHGRQVVSAGSVHPETGKHYQWDEFSVVPLGEEGPAPRSLIALAKRPAFNSVAQGAGGEYDQEEVANMLDALDPEDFQDQAKWLTLMQAVHHASGGEARSEFIEWSTRDAQFADDAWIIGRRWDSLHTNRQEGMVTYRSLHKYIRDAGKADAIIRPDDPDEDFGDDEIDFLDGADIPEGASHEKKSPLDRMNDRYICVSDGGKVVIMAQEYNPVTERRFWSRWSRPDFNTFLANRTILVQETNAKGEEKIVPKPVAEEWIKWPKRRSANGIVFDPEREHPNFLNLWTGWTVEPKKGDWSLLKDLILNALCDGNEEAYQFVYRWMAYMVQYPARPAEVAIAFHGDKGTGKSTLGKMLCRLCGDHGMATSSADQITGRFNSHFEGTLMLFADEAVRPSDRAAEAVLKTLITEDWMTIEGKGRDIKQAKNHIHLMLASNNEWFLPTSFGDGERRFFVSKVNNSRQGDVKFFTALHRQMDHGGLAAMLYDLASEPIGDWCPRNNIPDTQALHDQKFRNMDPIQQWWYTILNRGYIEEEPLRTDGRHWSEGGTVDFALDDLRTSFDLFCRSSNINPGASGRGLEMVFSQKLRTLCPSLPEKVIKCTPPDDRIDLSVGGDGRTRVYRLPALGICRQEFEVFAGFIIPWDADDDDKDFETVE
jgi:hypothetical protein